MKAHLLVFVDPLDARNNSMCVSHLSADQLDRVLDSHVVPSTVLSSVDCDSHLLAATTLRHEMAMRYMFDRAFAALLNRYGGQLVTDDKTISFRFVEAAQQLDGQLAAGGAQQAA